MITTKNTDALGNALLAYMSGEHNHELIILSDISEEDVIPLEYLFRSEKEFPEIEKKALDLCRGKILDVGAGSGCHSIVLNDKGFDVQAIDISEGAVEVMLQRNIKAKQLNFFDVTTKFDTLLFLMNGVGIAGNLKGLSMFLSQAKSLLNPGGQILLDSSDIAYMFKDEDGALWMDLNKSYYGEVVYQMQFQKSKTNPFNWLFVAYDKLKEEALKSGFNIELVFEDQSNQYLAKLWL